MKINFSICFAFLVDVKSKQDSSHPVLCFQRMDLFRKFAPQRLTSLCPKTSIIWIRQMLNQLFVWRLTIRWNANAKNCQVCYASQQCMRENRSSFAVSSSNDFFCILSSWRVFISMAIQSWDESPLCHSLKPSLLAPYTFIFRWHSVVTTLHRV